MERVEFRFYSTLNDFLSPERQQMLFIHCLKERASVKDAIEALGIPHPEIGLILVNGESVDFSWLIQDGDRVSVYPIFTTLPVTDTSLVLPPPLPSIRFVLDIHLGKLANYLRLFGFDTWYHNQADDETLANISSQEQRILLTQDRGLLKRRIVDYGYLVRSHDPKYQITEVLQRFDLWHQTAPLTRCLRCNGNLRPVEKDAIITHIPPLTQAFYDEFKQCQTCYQIYWKGAHYDRIQQFISTQLLRGN